MEPVDRLVILGQNADEGAQVEGSTRLPLPSST
jgi:hypothetical protein